MKKLIALLLVLMLALSLFVACDDNGEASSSSSAPGSSSPDGTEPGSGGNQDVPTIGDNEINFDDFFS